MRRQKIGLSPMTAAPPKDPFERILVEQIGQRVAPFDSIAAFQAGDLMARRHNNGQPGDLRPPPRLPPAIRVALTILLFPSSIPGQAQNGIHKFF